MKKNKIRLGFTLIEAMVVLFIIGVLAFIGAIGFGKVTRQKLVQQASNRVSTAVSNARDYSLFGKQINGNFPCGYGVALKTGSTEIKEAYTSGENVNRVKAMELDQSCDQLIENVEVELGSISDPENLSLGDASIQSTRQVRIENNLPIVGSEEDCLVVLFSAPRGKAYYCSGAYSSCPPVAPENCTFHPFTEEFDGNNNLIRNLFLSSVLLEDGNNSDQACVSIYPSGMSQMIADVPDCFSN